MNTASLPAALSVFGPAGLIGTLLPTEPLSFRYDETWLDTPAALSNKPFNLSKET
ncbi:hypothetical protein E7V67_008105 [[Empedobacter] haloabium]|uniref:HipA N-terminal subdomain 1 domain-containing protein n=1 Tax=[Empedobacter] haloabium TaxID=592317 RepID=A0ABZ1URV9_9BURK